MTQLLKILTQSNRILMFATLIFLLSGCSGKTPSTNKSQSASEQGTSDSTFESEFY
ncbi:MAG: lipoprotein, partial [Deltaproteobacteria bacterium]|nr:lipoprotein [Deltaproteobacteria bacterium]